MIAWLNPLALAGLAALAVPVVIHLLQQHRASRLPFPSLRFVHPSRTAAIRLRRVSDPWLLLVRMAALAFAAVALAQPIMLTPARVAAWNARVARAVIVDTSASMRLHGAEAAAREAAEAESQSAAVARRIETADLRAGLRQAAVWLSTAPPGVREVVIVSDFQAGALARGDLDEVPALAGFRAVQVGAAATGHAFDGIPGLLSGTARQRTAIRLDASTTQVTLTAGSEAAGGLRLVTTVEDEQAGQSLLRALAAAGTPAASPAEPIAAVFSGASPPGPLAAIAGGWMLGAAVRLMEGDELRDTAAAATGMASWTNDDPWIVASRDAHQRPVVRLAAAGPELVLEVADTPGGYLAAVAVRSVLRARAPESVYAEEEILRVSAADLAGWSRAPAPVGREVAVHAGRTDARWVWMLALLMLGLESLLRRSPRPAAERAHADAA